MFFPQISWVAVATVAKKCLNNRILTRRLKSKQHEEVSKAKRSPLSHLYNYSPKDEWWFSICASRAVGQGPDRATNCPAACLHSPEMVTGQTAHFPWNWTKLGVEGGCQKWQRRSRQNSHGNTTLDGSQGPVSWAKTGLSSWLSLSSIRSTTFCILSTYSPTRRGQEILRQSDTGINRTQSAPS